MRRFSFAIAALLWLALVPASVTAQSPIDASPASTAGVDALARVILTSADPARTAAWLSEAGGRRGRILSGAGTFVAFVPTARLAALRARPEVSSIRLDRPVFGTMERTAATVGAEWVAQQLGFDGTGVGVAIVDSGVTNWHDDLGASTVVHFADFVSDLPVPDDDYGHGTHVAGTIAGNGYDSAGARRGIAPGASLVVLKVLDAAGNGHISDVIAAIDYAIQQRERFNIRGLNLSVAAGVYESYTSDPLTLAAQRAVRAGIVVVTAAGNLGRTSKGAPQAGGITSPGNAPWVITVGATDHRGTAARGDDVVAPFSSRGPTQIDRAVKPDLVAPGVSIGSLAAPGSTIYTGNPDARIQGTVDTADAPYISLSGTSMAAPVVTGTIALMLEANPALTPNLVKAILQYTAERRPRYDVAAQGGGFLNARGAVQLAVMLRDGDAGPADTTRWSREVIWGNTRVRGGVLRADGSAWRADVVWGASTTPEGGAIVWGRLADTGTPWSGAERGDAPAAEDAAGAVTWSAGHDLVSAAAIEVNTAARPAAALSRHGAVLWGAILR